MKSWLSRAFGRTGDKNAAVAEAVNVDVYCSFCGKHRREVRKLVAGPNVYICDECIALCVHILDKEEPTSTYYAEMIVGHLAEAPHLTRHAVVTPRLRGAIDLANGRAAILRRIGAIAFNFEDHATALAAIDAIPMDQRTADVQLSAIAILADAARHGEALAALDALDPATLSDADVALHRLHRAYSELERGTLDRVQLAVHRKTALDLAAATEAVPAGQFQDSMRGERLSVLALALLGLGELDDALAAARERTELQPANASAREVLARVLDARGDRAAAVTARDEALERAHPDGPLATKLRASASSGPFR